MCGIATLTDRYVQAVAGTRARILDTRKTAPGLRALDKYAVTAAAATTTASISRRWSCSRRTTSPRRAG